ncbi:alkaline phosphatase D family protein [Fulvivirgaceae bacterium BMA10]|uniref:Alkaline phosphatase D family protein n=1 Tax=Splendidivirga corallicola TaxID=3051826 RepID=A0ABT8KV65_9BACT|nr:alkaline phosphatase D family protein [Fulvivirgaceae bacterium BMA10]
MRSGLLLYFLTLTMFSNAQHFGTSEHPVNKKTDNLILLDYWQEKSAAEKSIYKSAYQIFSNNRNATYADLIKDKSFRALCQEHHILKLGGPMLGKLTKNSVSVWVRTVKPAKVEVEVSGGDMVKRYGPVHSSPESDLTAIVHLTDLKPSTTYEYKVFIEGNLIKTAQKSQFKTLPADIDTSGVRIAFGSCPHRWGLGNEKLFDQIHNRNPDALLLLGDIAVQDRDNHLGLHRADYLLRDFYLAWQNFAASVPVYASWDDHDYFNNDKAGIPSGYTEQDKENVWKVFKHAWNNPAYGLGEHGKGIFFRTRIGPSDIIMTDNRYFRSGEKGSFLGREQMDWLKEQLLDCKGPFIILSCGSMWSDYVSNGKDSWGVNAPDAREEIFQLIEENNISGVILISGDRHGARGFYIPRPSGFKFYEFEAASLGGRVGPPATHTSWNTQLFGIDGKFAFGELTFDTSLNDPEVTFRLIGEDGSMIYTQTIRRSQLTPKNYQKK